MRVIKYTCDRCNDAVDSDGAILKIESHPRAWSSEGVPVYEGGAPPPLDLCRGCMVEFRRFMDKLAPAGR